MSIEDTNVATDEVDLDSFSDELFGQSKPEADVTNPEEDKEDTQEADATDENEDTPTSETDTLENEDEDTDETDNSDEDEIPEDKPVEKPKSRAQKRIEELVAKDHEKERANKALQARIEALEAKLNSPSEDEKTVTAAEKAGPSVDAKNEDGSDKYPLGEFDPNYIRDLTKFTLQQEREAIKAEEAKEAQQKQYEAEREALNKSWTEKLVPAQERYPDFQEKGEQLFDTFSNINQQYGEYLTATLMSLDYGPDVLYYLANNIDEANKIVASGPTKATIALGRLEAKFLDADEQKQKARPKVSKAPAPPAARLKGVAVVADVPDDTDDLDAFSNKLFKKK